MALADVGRGQLVLRDVEEHEPLDGIEMRRWLLGLVTTTTTATAAAATTAATLNRGSRGRASSRRWRT